jgi:hypothetical protein
MPSGLAGWSGVAGGVFTASFAFSDDESLGEECGHAVGSAAAALSLERVDQIDPNLSQHRARSFTFSL